MRPVRSLASLLAAALLCSCIETVPATQVIVSISSDLELGEELVSITAAVGTLGEEITASRSFEVSPGAGSAATLPIQYAILPGPQGGNFLIIVEGFGKDERGVIKKVIEQRVITSFSRRRASLVPIALNHQCKDVFCEGSRENVCILPSNRSLDRGECGPIEVLPPNPVDPSEIDAAVDVSERDAGKDAGLDASPPATGPDGEAGQLDGGDDDEPIPAPEGGPDGGPEGGPEAGPDATDAGTDGGADTSVAPTDGGAASDASPDRDGCIMWLDSQRTLAIPSAAIQRGSEQSFSSWPNGVAETVFHYVCQVDVLGARLPGKLSGSYGCYAAHGTMPAMPSQYRVPTLASHCRVRWVESGGAAPANAVIAGESQGLPLMPCEAPVAVEAFPIDAGDTYEPHRNDTHLGYTSAADYGCRYEYVNKVHRADAGFSVLVWDP